MTRAQENAGRRPWPRDLTLVLALAATVGACDRGEADTESPEPEAGRDAPTAARVCSDGARFTDYDWVPDDARQTTSIARLDPELGPALARLAALSESGELQLPVLASMNYRNLGMQLSILDRLLDELGAAPDELVEIHGPEGELAWLWPNDCPVELLATRLLARWQLVLRADLERPGLRRGAGSPEGLPFDLLLVGERHVVLTLLGRGQVVASWLHDRAHGDDEGPGRALADLDAAPIRSVLSGDALLADSPTPNTPASESRLLRVTAQSWEAR